MTETTSESLKKAEIAEWLERVHFRRQLLGGLNEADVWKKIRELNQKYEELLAAERIRYDTLLEEYQKRAERAGPPEDDR